MALVEKHIASAQSVALEQPAAHDPCFFFYICVNLKNKSLNTSGLSLSSKSMWLLVLRSVHTHFHAHTYTSFLTPLKI